jgi:maleate isomerase
MTSRIKRIGMLTPSSNTVLEPVTTAMIQDVKDEVTVHFSRFKVTEISLKSNALLQFDFEPMLEAAQLLADADVDVIAWNGTSAGWLGVEADVQLCQKITQKTGIPATTSVLALLEAFQLYGVERYGLVTPYTADVNEKIIQTFNVSELTCIMERHCGISVNKLFSGIGGEHIREMAREVALPDVQAITTFCTNLKAAPYIDELEREHGIPIFDTISVVVWKSLRMAGINPAKINGWGRLFGDTHLYD